MTERRPNFEDDKIRAWIFAREKKPPEKFEKDPTVLSIDMESEEIFESRTYRLLPNVETVSLIFEALTPVLTEEDLEQRGEELAAFIRHTIETVGIKILAKRRKSNDALTFVIVGIGIESRHLLKREEWVTEDKYRRTVEDFEEDLARKGIFGPPLIVSAEEWRRYDLDSWAEKSKE